MKINVSIQKKNQNHRVAFVTRVNFVCVQMRHAICGVRKRKIHNYPAQLLDATQSSLHPSNEWAEFWPELMKFPVDMLNHTHHLPTKNNYCLCRKNGPLQISHSPDHTSQTIALRTGVKNKLQLFFERVEKPVHF